MVATKVNRPLFTSSDSLFSSWKPFDAKMLQPLRDTSLHLSEYLLLWNPHWRSILYPYQANQTSDIARKDAKDPRTLVRPQRRTECTESSRSSIHPWLAFGKMQVNSPVHSEGQCDLGGLSANEEIWRCVRRVGATVILWWCLLLVGNLPTSGWTKKGIKVWFLGR